MRHGRVGAALDAGGSDNVTVIAARPGLCDSLKHEVLDRPARRVLSLMPRRVSQPEKVLGNPARRRKQLPDGGPKLRSPHGLAHWMGAHAHGGGREPEAFEELSGAKVGYMAVA